MGERACKTIRHNYIRIEIDRSPVRPPTRKSAQTHVRTRPEAPVRTRLGIPRLDALGPRFRPCAHPRRIRSRQGVVAVAVVWFGFSQMNQISPSVRACIHACICKLASRVAVLLSNCTRLLIHEQHDASDRRTFIAHIVGARRRYQPRPPRLLPPAGQPTGCHGEGRPCQREHQAGPR